MKSIEFLKRLQEKFSNETWFFVTELTEFKNSLQAAIAEFEIMRDARNKALQAEQEQRDLAEQLDFEHTHMMEALEKCKREKEGLRLECTALVENFKAQRDELKKERAPKWESRVDAATTLALANLKLCIAGKSFEKAQDRIRDLESMRDNLIAERDALRTTNREQAKTIGALLSATAYQTLNDELAAAHEKIRRMSIPASEMAFFKAEISNLKKQLKGAYEERDALRTANCAQFESNRILLNENSALKLKVSEPVDVPEYETLKSKLADAHKKIETLEYKLYKADDSLHYIGAVVEQARGWSKKLKGD